MIIGEIATITYRQSSGSGLDDRQIHFHRFAGYGSLRATFSVIGTGEVLATLTDDQISVEMETAADKARNIMAARAGQSVLSRPNRPLSTFMLEIQDQIIRLLNANSSEQGGRWITFKSIPGTGLETISNFVITEPIERCTEQFPNSWIDWKKKNGI